MASRRVDTPPPADETRSERPEPATRRLRSLDAARGFAIVILLLAGSPWYRSDHPDHLRHPEWHGLTFADDFFPLFLFVVGVAMTLSRRAAEPRHVLRRVALLAVIGIALTSLKHGTFIPVGVLQHIAGAYLLAWLVLQTPRRMQGALTVAIFGAIWIGYLLYAGGEHDPWSRDRTLAHAVDGFLVGRFATEGTLQTIMSSVTVLAGAFIGRGIREHPDPRALLRWVAIHGAWLIVVALLISGWVPINKRIWSPSYTLLTIGTSCAWFALFIWLIDIRGHTTWIAPLEELGANPIAIYVGFMTITSLVSDVPVPRLEPLGNATAGALVYSVGWLVAGWLCARALYRRRIFIKI